jgi:hypothetical protein
MFRWAAKEPEISSIVLNPGPNVFAFAQGRRCAQDDVTDVSTSGMTMVPAMMPVLNRGERMTAIRLMVLAAAGLALAG